MVMSDSQPFFASDLAGSVRSPLQMILELGETTNIEVIIGLVHDSDYWLRITQPTAAVARYLANRESTDRPARDGDCAAFAQLPEFRWMVHERGDRRHQLARAGGHLRFALLLQRVSDYLRLAFPGTPVAISGFSNAHGTPAQLEVFWRELLSAAPAIGTVLFQDGIGARKLTLENLPRYLRAVVPPQMRPDAGCGLGRTCSSRLGRAARFGRVPCSAAPFPEWRPAASRSRVRVGAHRVQRR